MGRFAHVEKNSVTYVDGNIVIYFDERGKVGVRAIHEDVVANVLLPPVYEEVLLLSRHKVLLAYEKREEGRIVVGVYSPSLKRWIHEPHFTDVKTYGNQFLHVSLDSQHGYLDITTGVVNWIH